MNIEVNTEKFCKQIKNLLLPSSSRSLVERMPGCNFHQKCLWPEMSRRDTGAGEAAER